jgi:hypothetical protein
MNKELGKFTIQTTHNFMRPPQLRFGYRVIYQYKVDDFCTLFDSATVFEDENEAVAAGKRWLLRMIAAGNEAIAKEVL